MQNILHLKYVNINGWNAKQPWIEAQMSANEILCVAETQLKPPNRRGAEAGRN